MAGVEITDEKSLEAWLKTRPRGDALIIHGRSAIRNHMPTTFGLIVGGDEKNNRLLSYLRFLQVTGLMRTYPHKALEHAFAYATKDFQTLRPTQLVNIDLAKILTFDDYDQELQAIDEINPVRLAEVVAKQEQWLEDAQYLNLVLSARDCDALANGHIIAPIWHDAIPPDWFTKADAETRAIWAKDPETWAFWVRWWDGVIAGKPLPFDPQRDVALIEDEVWQQGPKAVAEAIRAIEMRHALARTENGERIEVNPDTGKLRLVGEAALPDDVGRYARRKMAKALALFGDEPANQYRPLDAPIRIVREALGDMENLPVELFDACAGATRMVATLVQTQSIPAHDQDALIGEFVTILREAAADILGGDTVTQETLARRKAFEGDSGLLAHAAEINLVVGQIAIISEGALQRLLPQNAEAALNSHGGEEARRVGGFKLAGRLIRFANLVKSVGEHIEAYKGVYGAIAVIAAHPSFQVVWSFILKWIGLG